MNIIVLNGSPKGKLSGTLQYVNFLAKAYPQHQFEDIAIAQQIRVIEQSDEKFAEIMDKIQKADAVIWSFPLYFLLIHAGLKRFIELVFERKQQSAFVGKYTVSISTSIHFYDHTANNYIHGICEDLQMKFVGAFSPHMRDLMEEKGREQLLQFGRLFFTSIERQLEVQPAYAPLQLRDFQYQSGPIKSMIDTTRKKVLILHDALPDEHNTLQMVAHARTALGDGAEVINLRDINIKGSCQGCMQCGGSYHCSYEGKDDYIEFYKSKVMTADILIYAGTIHDRYLSSRWKTLFDRSFFNTHTPVLMNKQMLWMISGPMQQLQNLNEILRAYCEFQGPNLVNIITDETGSSEQIDRLIEQQLALTIENAKVNASRPVTFLGEGGMKIFRDEIWGGLRVVFPADYKAFRKLGFFKTFPQRSVINFILNTLAYPLLEIPSIRNKMFVPRIKESMVAPYQQIIAQTKFD